MRAATPSNAAELAVPDSADIREALSGAGARLVQSMKKKLAVLSSGLNELKSRKAITSPMAYIDLKRMELDFLRSRFASAADS
jgi:exodeoxyribonuclease VII large subunit